MSEVTCIIPTHQRPALLEEALRSVAAQTLRPSRTIVVSDVEDARARDTCRRVTAESGLVIEYVEQHESPGASGSRNEGARLASTPLLAFLDDDDLWDIDYLHAALERLEDENTDLCLTWLLEFDDRRTADGGSAPLGLGPEDVGSINPGATGSNLIIDASVYWRIEGFDPRLPVKNDTDLLYRLLRSGASYTVVERRLVRQRRNHGGQLTGKTERRAAGTDAYLEKHLDHLTKEDVRVLRMYAHRIRAVSAATPWARGAHRLHLLRLHTRAELIEALRRRVRASSA